MRYTKEKAQTNVDYIISIGLFFTTLAIVVSATSFLLVPDIQSNENKVISQSVSEQLTQEKLVHPDNSNYTLSRECTVLFFDSMQTNTLPDNTPEWCEITSTTLNESLLLDSDRTIAVEITDFDQNIVTLNETNLQINQSNIPDQGNVQTAQKYIYIDQNQYILTVYTW